MFAAKINSNNFLAEMYITQSYLKKAQKNIIKIAITLAVAIGAFFVFFSNSSLVTAVDAQAFHIEGVGVETEKLINEIQNHSFEINYIGEIKRSSFAVPGSLVTLGGDNIQIYEYLSPEESLMAAESFRKSQEMNQWKDHTHVYTKGTVLVFYLGSRENILKTLDEVMAAPHPEISEYRTLSYLEFFDINNYQ